MILFVLNVVIDVAPQPPEISPTRVLPFRSKPSMKKFPEASKAPK